MSPDRKENNTLTRTPSPVLPVKDKNILLSPRLQQKYIITIVTTISNTQVQNTRQEQRHEHRSD